MRRRKWEERKRDEESKEWKDGQERPRRGGGVGEEGKRGMLEGDLRRICRAGGSVEEGRR